MAATMVCGTSALSSPTYVVRCNSHPCRAQRARRQVRTWAAARYATRLVGTGSSAPSTVLSNADLTKLVDTNDEWITARTGIRRRHVLADGETLKEHAVRASQSALDMAGIAAEDVDLIIFATSSADDAFGGACGIQAELGARRAAAFDLTAACSGFVMGVVTAAQYLATGTYRNVLVIGGDALSRFVDWSDRGTCILFGDGAGALVMTRREADDPAPCALLGSAMCSDGTGQRHLHSLFQGAASKALAERGTPGVATPPAYANLFMNGGEVFKFAVRAVPSVVQTALDRAGMTKDEIDWLVLHQANLRILHAAADRLGVSRDHLLCNLEEYGNTSAASIPLVLDEAVRRGDVAPGQVLALAGFGAGLTWASAIVRWG